MSLKKSTLAAFVVLVTATAARGADIPEPKFEPQTIDAKVGIGYGLAIGDVDGDGKPDILLADKKQIVWYRNPDWKRFVMAEDLTPQDNVCIAARDIDGSGKVSVAVGAGWNPNETNDLTKSGAVFYLIRPADPTQRWEPVRLRHEVTTHRMQWVRVTKDKFQLVVVPLHGLGNKDGKGAGVKIFAYEKPADPHDKWPMHLVDDSMHMTHNFDLWFNQHTEKEMALVAGREGIKWCYAESPYAWKAMPYDGLTNAAGEVRFTTLSGDFDLATIEPMHGNQVVFYRLPNAASEKPKRVVIDDTLAEGHALACFPMFGRYPAQIIAGWRVPNKEKKVGIRMYSPLDDAGEKWKTFTIDDNHMACEDLKVADLDGDGRPDIIAAGRSTHNLIIYWNRTGK
jgi:hypothetical protein